MLKRLDRRLPLCQQIRILVTYCGHESSFDTVDLACSIFGNQSLSIRIRQREWPPMLTFKECWGGSWIVILLKKAWVEFKFCRNRRSLLVFLT